MLRHNLHRDPLQPASLQHQQQQRRRASSSAATPTDTNTAAPPSSSSSVGRRIGQYDAAVHPHQLHPRQSQRAHSAPREGYAAEGHHRSALSSAGNLTARRRIQNSSEEGVPRTVSPSSRRSLVHGAYVSPPAAPLPTAHRERQLFNFFGSDAEEAASDTNDGNDGSEDDDEDGMAAAVRFGLETAAVLAADIALFRRSGGGPPLDLISAYGYSYEAKTIHGKKHQGDGGVGREKAKSAVPGYPFLFSSYVPFADASAAARKPLVTVGGANSAAAFKYPLVAGGGRATGGGSAAVGGGTVVGRRAVFDEEWMRRRQQRQRKEYYSVVLPAARRLANSRAAEIAAASAEGAASKDSASPPRSALSREAVSLSSTTPLSAVAEARRAAVQSWEDTVVSPLTPAVRRWGSSAAASSDEEDDDEVEQRDAVAPGDTKRKGAPPTAGSVLFTPSPCPLRALLYEAEGAPNATHLAAAGNASSTSPSPSPSPAGHHYSHVNAAADSTAGTASFHVNYFSEPLAAGAARRSASAGGVSSAFPSAAASPIPKASGATSFCAPSRLGYTSMRLGYVTNMHGTTSSSSAAFWDASTSLLPSSGQQQQQFSTPQQRQRMQQRQQQQQLSSASPPLLDAAAASHANATVDASLSYAEIHRHQQQHQQQQPHSSATAASRAMLRPSARRSGEASLATTATGLNASPPLATNGGGRLMSPPAPSVVATANNHSSGSSNAKAHPHVRTSSSLAAAPSDLLNASVASAQRHRSAAAEAAGRRSEVRPAMGAAGVANMLALMGFDRSVLGPLVQQLPNGTVSSSIASSAVDGLCEVFLSVGSGGGSGVIGPFSQPSFANPPPPPPQRPASAAAASGGLFASSVASSVASAAVDAEAVARYYYQRLNAGPLTGVPLPDGSRVGGSGDGSGPSIDLNDASAAAAAGSGAANTKKRGVLEPGGGNAVLSGECAWALLRLIFGACREGLGAVEAVLAAAAVAGATDGTSSCDPSALEAMRRRVDGLAPVLFAEEVSAHFALSFAGLWRRVDGLGNDGGSGAPPPISLAQKHRLVGAHIATAAAVVARAVPHPIARRAAAVLKEVASGLVCVAGASSVLGGSGGGSSNGGASEAASLAKMWGVVADLLCLFFTIPPSSLPSPSSSSSLLAFASGGVVPLELRREGEVANPSSPSLSPSSSSLLLSPNALTPAYLNAHPSVDYYSAADLARLDAALCRFLLDLQVLPEPAAVPSLRPLALPLTSSPGDEGGGYGHSQQWTGGNTSNAAAEARCRRLAAAGADFTARKTKRDNENTSAVNAMASQRRRVASDTSVDEALIGAMVDPLAAPFIAEGRAYGGLSAASGALRVGRGNGIVTPGVYGHIVGTKGGGLDGDGDGDDGLWGSLQEDAPRGAPPVFVPRSTPLRSILDPTVFPYLRNGTLLCDIAAKLVGDATDIVAAAASLGGKGGALVGGFAAAAENRLTTVTKAAGTSGSAASFGFFGDSRDSPAAGAAAGVGARSSSSTSIAAPSSLTLASFTRNPRVARACLVNTQLALRLFSVALTRGAVAKRRGVVGGVPLGGRLGAAGMGAGVSSFSLSSTTGGGGGVGGELFSLCAANGSLNTSLNPQSSLHHISATASQQQTTNNAKRRGANPLLNVSNFGNGRLNGSVAAGGGGGTAAAVTSSYSSNNIPFLAPYCLSDAARIYNGDVHFIMALLEDLMRFVFGAAPRGGGGALRRSVGVGVGARANSSGVVSSSSEVVAAAGPFLPYGGGSVGGGGGGVSGGVELSVRVEDDWRRWASSNGSRSASTAGQQRLGASVAPDAAHPSSAFATIPVAAPVAVAKSIYSPSKRSHSQPQANGSAATSNPQQQPQQRRLSPAAAAAAAQRRRAETPPRRAAAVSSSSTAAAAAAADGFAAVQHLSQQQQQQWQERRGGSVVDTEANPHMAYLAAIPPTSDEECAALGAWLSRKLGPRYAHSARDGSFSVDVGECLGGGSSASPSGAGSGAPLGPRALLLHPRWFVGGTCHLGGTVLLNNNNGSQQQQTMVGGTSSTLEGGNVGGGGGGGSSKNGPPRGHGRCWLFSDGIVLLALAKALVYGNSAKLRGPLLGAVSANASAPAAKKHNVRLILRFLAEEKRMGVGKHGVGTSAASATVAGSDSPFSSSPTSVAASPSSSSPFSSVLSRTFTSIANAPSLEDAITTGDLRAVVMVLREVRSAFRSHVEAGSGGGSSTAGSGNVSGASALVGAAANRSASYSAAAPPAAPFSRSGSAVGSASRPASSGRRGSASAAAPTLVHAVPAAGISRPAAFDTSAVGSRAYYASAADVTDGHHSDRVIDYFSSDKAGAASASHHRSGGAAAYGSVSSHQQSNAADTSAAHGGHKEAEATTTAASTSVFSVQYADGHAAATAARYATSHQYTAASNNNSSSISAAADAANRRAAQQAPPSPSPTSPMPMASSSAPRPTNRVLAMAEAAHSLLNSNNNNANAHAVSGGGVGGFFSPVSLQSETSFAPIAESASGVGIGSASTTLHNSIGVTFNDTVNSSTAAARISNAAAAAYASLESHRFATPMQELAGLGGVSAGSDPLSSGGGVGGGRGYTYSGDDDPYAEAGDVGDAYAPPMDVMSEGGTRHGPGVPLPGAQLSYELRPPSYPSGLSTPMRNWM